MISKVIFAQKYKTVFLIVFHLGQLTMGLILHVFVPSYVFLEKKKKNISPPTHSNLNFHPLKSWPELCFPPHWRADRQTDFLVGSKMLFHFLTDVTRWLADLFSSSFAQSDKTILRTNILQFICYKEKVLINIRVFK